MSTSTGWLSMRSRYLLVLALAAACRNAPSEPDQMSGSYALQRVNGHQLPVTTSSTLAARVDVVRAVLVIDSGIVIAALLHRDNASGDFFARETRTERWAGAGITDTIRINDKIAAFVATSPTTIEFVRTDLYERGEFSGRALVLHSRDSTFEYLKQ